MKNLNFLKCTFFLFLMIFGVTSAQKLPKPALKHFAGKARLVGLSKKKAISTQLIQFPDGSVGVGSCVGTDGIGYYSADDFMFEKTTDLSYMEFIGYQDSNNLEDLLKGAVLYIYEDNNGKPAGIPGKSGTPVFSLDLAADDPKLESEKLDDYIYDFLVDTSGFQAQPNKKYWVVFAPKINFSETLSYEEMWNWFGSPDYHFSDSVNVDPDDYFNGGITQWYSLYDAYGDFFGDSIKGLSMALYGDTVLGTSDAALAKEISISPNPASTEFTVNVNDFAKSEIIDANGRVVKASNQKTTSVSELQKGLYFVKVTTKNGKTAVKKLIKK